MGMYVALCVLLKSLIYGYMGTVHVSGIYQAANGYIVPRVIWYKYWMANILKCYSHATLYSGFKKIDCS